MYLPEKIEGRAQGVVCSAVLWLVPLGAAIEAAPREERTTPAAVAARAILPLRVCVVIGELNVVYTDCGNSGVIREYEVVEEDVSASIDPLGLLEDTVLVSHHERVEAIAEHARNVNAELQGERASAVHRQVAVQVGGKSSSAVANPSVEHYVSRVESISTSNDGKRTFKEDREMAIWAAHATA